MIGGKKIQVGLAHARKTVEVTTEADTNHITVKPGITITVFRTTGRDIRGTKPPATPCPQAASSCALTCAGTGAHSAG